MNDIELPYSFSIANQFWSDPHYMSSCVDASFRPQAARPGEVVLLIPNLYNPTETIPINVPQEQLLNIYIGLLGTQGLAPVNQSLPITQPMTFQDVQMQW